MKIRSRVIRVASDDSLVLVLVVEDGCGWVGVDGGVNVICLYLSSLSSCGLRVLYLHLLVTILVGRFRIKLNQRLLIRLPNYWENQGCCLIYGLDTKQIR